MGPVWLLLIRVPLLLICPKDLQIHAMLVLMKDKPWILAVEAPLKASPVGLSFVCLGDPILPALG